jgi:septal ring factor EnvC (AmiA/AmiB activator)
MYCVDLGDRRTDSVKTASLSHSSTSKGSISTRVRDFSQSLLANKENIGNIANGTGSLTATMEISQSKSYLMAMKALQHKLDEKDQRIKQLEALLKESHSSSFMDARQKERLTANFVPIDRYGQLVEEGDVMRLRVQPISLDQTLAKGIDDETSAACSGEQNFSKNPLQRQACGCHQMETLQAKHEELTREFELISKKLANSKEQCAKLQEGLDFSNRQISSMENGILKKDKEIDSLNTALRSMKELVDIISKKRKDNSVEEFDTLESLHSANSNLQYNEFTLSQDQNRGPTLNQGKGYIHAQVAGQKHSSKEAKQPAESFESIVQDMIIHILLNPELTFDDVDLFSCMLERLKEFPSAFRLIEENYDYLKKTKSLLVQKSTVGNLHPRPVKNLGQ